jgi:hypothetical protein
MTGVKTSLLDKNTGTVGDPTPGETSGLYW